MSGWGSKRLDEVCLNIQDGAHRSPQVLFNEPGEGRFPYITSKNIGNGVMKFDRVEYCDAEFHNDIYPRCNVAIGDVLLTKDGANTGNVAINTLDAPFSLLSSVCLLKTDANLLTPKFLCYYLQSEDGVRQITGQMTGAAIKRIILKTIRSSKIPLPPLPEQQRIVAILDEAFAGIATAKANTEKNLANARALFESHLQGVFTQRDPSHVARLLDDVCDEITVGHVGSMASKYRESGVPFLRSQNVRPFRVTLENVVYIDEQFHRSLAKSSLKPGDVAIVRTGYPGTAAVIPDTLPCSNCSDLVIARPGREIDAHYLAIFFNSDHGKRLVAGEVVGAAQKHFNVTAAKRVTICLPSVAEQRRIVTKVNVFASKTQRLDSLLQQKLAALDALKRSLLQHAFAGRLTGGANQRQVLGDRAVAGGRQTALALGVGRPIE